jgi:hypothetical protein
VFDSAEPFERAFVQPAPEASSSFLFSSSFSSFNSSFLLMLHTPQTSKINKISTEIIISCKLLSPIFVTSAPSSLATLCSQQSVAGVDGGKVVHSLLEVGLRCGINIPQPLLLFSRRLTTEATIR